MSSGNRVEQLEKRVRELEATVQGLTEELVEANERIRQLEQSPVRRDDSAGATDTDLSFDDAEPVESEAGGDSDDEAADGPDDDLDLQFEIDPGADPEEVERAANQIAPEDADERRADTTNSTDDDGGDEGDMDDIIVA
ncbi:MAG: hypothetical protein V5A23_04815 [Halobacteriales archaeon]